MGRIVLISILVGIHIFLEIPTGAYLVRATSYSFFHANWWHLAINSIAILSIYKKCKPGRDLIVPFLIAVLVYPLSFRPVIGFSNVLYATLGMRTPKLSSPWWKQTSVIVFLVITVLMLFIPRFSATTHIASFLLGMLCASINRFFKSTLNDARRYL